MCVCVYLCVCVYVRRGTCDRPETKASARESTGQGVCRHPCFGFSVWRSSAPNCKPLNAAFSCVYIVTTYDEAVRCPYFPVWFEEIYAPSDKSDQLNHEIFRCCRLNTNFKQQILRSDDGKLEMRDDCR